MAPSRSAAASSLKKPSNPAGEVKTSTRPDRGTTRRWACGTPPRRKHDSAGAGPKFRFADLEDVLPLEHVEQLVLILVNVERRVDWFVLLKDRERSARGIGRSFHYDFDFAEPQAFSAFRANLVRWDVGLPGHVVVSSIG